MRLGDVLDSALGGGTPARGIEDYWGGTIPWATVKDMGAATLERTIEFITEAGVAASATRVIPAGTVLLATRMAVGAVTWTACDTAINQDLKALVPSPSLDGRFLFQFLLARQAKLEAAGSGTTVKGIGVDFVRSLPILLPPLPEQRAIAAVLDSIDEAIERTEEVIAATERLRDALLHELLTRGLPGHHTAWRDVPGLGAIPACWEAVRLGDVAEVQTGRAVNRNTSQNGRMDVPYLSVANVKDGYVDLHVVKRMRVSQEEIERYAVRAGDVLFTEGGDADKLGRGTVWRGELDPCLHQNHVFVVRPHRDTLLPNFLSAFATSHTGRRYFLGAAKQTTNLASINSTQLKGMRMPLPTLREQQAIVGTLDSVDAAIEGAREERAALQSSKASTADALLTGRVRVQRQAS